MYDTTHKMAVLLDNSKNISAKGMCDQFLADSNYRRVCHTKLYQLLSLNASTAFKLQLNLSSVLGRLWVLRGPSVK